MQKKVIALAVAGLVSGVAFAQSNVTVYGVVDSAYVYGKGDSGKLYNSSGVATGDVGDQAGYSGTNKFAGIFAGGWSSPRVGFRGKENLGGGLEAIFQMEFGTDTDGDTGLAKTRKAFVGLKGGFGTVTAGRLYAPYNEVDRNHGLEGATFSPMQVFSRSLAQYRVGLHELVGDETLGIRATTFGGGSNGRWNNAIGFESKKYSGFQARAVYSFGETSLATTSTSTKGSDGSVALVGGANAATTKTTDNGRFGLGLEYEKGPFNVDFVYHKTMNIRATYPETPANQAQWNLEGGDINEWYIGGGYDFKAVKLMASYQRTRSDWYPTQVVRRELGLDLWSLSAIVPVGAKGKFRVEYANAQYHQPNDIGLANGARQDGTSRGLGIGYTHNLSKRTMLFTTVNYIKNDKDALANGGDGKDVFVGARGESNTIFMMGAAHRF